MAARIAPFFGLAAARRDRPRSRRARRARLGRARSARASSCSGRARRSCRAARPRPPARSWCAGTAGSRSSARSAASPSPDICAMNDGRDPTRPGLVKSRIAHRSPSPFSIGVPVSARRVWAGIRRSCWEVSLVGFLIACASSSTSVCQLVRGERVDVAHGGGVGGDHDVGAGDLGFELVGRRSRRAVVDDDAQPGREARRFGRPVADDRGGRDDERLLPSPAVRARWASTVGVLPRPMSSARHPPSSAASRNPIQATASAW